MEHDIVMAEADIGNINLSDEVRKLSILFGYLCFAVAPFWTDSKENEGKIEGLKKRV